MSSAATTPEVPTGAQDPAPAPRTPLSVVPRRAVRRSRVSTLVMCALALAAALVGILLLNIQISSGQYRLTELTAEQRALSQENEALTQDIEAESAPQTLAARANDLGMVQARDVGTVDLATGAVTAAPGAAPEGEAEDILVPPARMKGSEAAEQNRKDAEQRTEKRAEEEARRAAERRDARAPDGGLHGGSIPAPAQRAPGH